MCPDFLLKKNSLIDEADRQIEQKSAPKEQVVLVKIADFLTGHAEVAQEDCY